jgi:hypothetical protein
VNEILGEYGVCCFGKNGLFLLYLDGELKFWKMNTAHDLKFVRSLHFPASTPTSLPNRLLPWEMLEMDDEYIAVMMQAEHETAEDGSWFTVYFISTKTFQIERSLSTVRKYNSTPRYERGFLVVPSSDSIR